MLKEEVVKTFLEGVVTIEFLSKLKAASREASLSRELGGDPAFMSLLVERPEEEASRVLANIMYHCPEARKWWSSTFNFQETLKVLEAVKLGKEGEGNFLALRLLFLASIEAEVVPKLAPYLQSLLALCQQCLDGGGKEQEIMEILRILYNVRKQGTDCASDQATTELIRGSFEKSGNPFMLGNIFNLSLLLDPASLSRVGPAMFLKGLDCLVLLYSQGGTDDRRSAVDFLSVACLVLTRLCEDDDKTRRFLRRRILPSSFDRSLPSPAEVNPLKAALTRLLQHPVDRVSLAAGDFLFALVARRLPRLIYHLGYGCCAGFLYSRNLLSPGQTVGEGEDLERLGGSSDEEAIKREGLDGWDPVTGRLLLPEGDGATSMTEEEKEVEGGRLMGLLDRLEQTGIVKFYTKKKRPFDDGE